jgi:glycosyltransferase involved in cell wall biosynthesis
VLKPKLISVIMSVYNTDFVTVKRAIDSVLNQSCLDFELIIIDDGSNNNTQDLLLNYCIKHGDKITYLRHTNCGQSESINDGVKISKGEYITIIDADDEYEPNHLSSCLHEINGIDLIASTTQTVVDKEQDYYVPDRNNHNVLIHVDECILFATLFGKKKVFIDVPFQKNYAADAKFYEIASINYAVKKVNLRTYIYYRNNPNSLVSTMKKSKNGI